jgi:hypothetical protein
MARKPLRSYNLSIKGLDVKSIKTFLCVTLLAVLVACGGATVANYIATIDTGVQAVLVYDPSLCGTLCASKINALASTAETAALNWKPGTNGQLAVEALNALAAGLDDLQLGSKADNLIAALVNSIDNLITLIQNESSAVTVAEQTNVFEQWVSATGGAVPVQRKHVWIGKQIKSAKQLQKALKSLGVK